MFEEMADNDKARFQREKAEYNMHPNGRFKHARLDILGSTDGALLNDISSIRSKRDPNAPKRPLCGFMYFSAEERGKVLIYKEEKHKKTYVFHKRCAKKTQTSRLVRSVRSSEDDGLRLIPR